MKGVEHKKRLSCSSYINVGGFFLIDGEVRCPVQMSVDGPLPTQSVYIRLVRNHWQDISTSRPASGLIESLRRSLDQIHSNTALRCASRAESEVMVTAARVVAIE
jgi:hypothetical protein